MGQVSLPNPLPVQFALGGLATELEWGPVGRDLLGVAASILLADRLVMRGRHGPRRVELSIPVSLPSLWTAAKPRIEEAMSILSGDRFGCTFTPAERSSLLPFLGTQQRIRSGMSVDQVALFSGGLDSAAAAATFMRRGVTTAYVTHYTKGIDAISCLLDDIGRAYGRDECVQHAQFYLRPVGPLVRAMRERSRRARSFFYVSLALATAAAVNTNEVQVCENGILALNLPLEAGMLPTRHAHNEFLHAMERLGQMLFERPMRVSNPFQLHTKGQMTQVFDEHPELALRTMSCWNQQWSGRGKSYSKGHCGLCLPCLVRLISLNAAGVTIPLHHFDRDPRVLLSKNRNADRVTEELGMARMLKRFAERVISCRNWRDFVLRFPEASLASPTSGALAGEEWVRKVYRMFRRFAGEVGRSMSRVEL